jgi:hypothetical protein
MIVGTKLGWLLMDISQYEYVAVYVDDLAIAMKDPKDFTDLLEQKKSKELVQFLIIWELISVEMKIAHCVLPQQNTLISSSRTTKIIWSAKHKCSISIRKRRPSRT